MQSLKMPSRPSYRPHRRRQHSAFLKLPPEIRNHIYQFALVSPNPIDLWPHHYIHQDDEFTEDSDIQQRRKSFESIQADYQDGLLIRLQNDLIHVRKEISTGLLGTCVQIYREAMGVFWADNHWRFSGDDGWEGLLRFLLTIGQSARARIQNLQVVAPNLACSPLPLFPRVKNHPKMRMAKLWKERFHGDHHHTVFNLLKRDATPHSLTFLIPSGRFMLYSGYLAWGFPDDQPDYRFVCVNVVVEAGGTLQQSGPLITEDTDWELSCLPGSTLYGESGNAVLITEPITWKPDREIERLAGLSQLFIEDEDSIRSNGGRASIPCKRWHLARSLTAFGPSMILTKEIRCTFRRWGSSSRSCGKLLDTVHTSMVDRNERSVQDWVMGTGGLEPQCRWTYYCNS